MFSTRLASCHTGRMFSFLKVFLHRGQTGRPPETERMSVVQLRQKTWPQSMVTGSRRLRSGADAAMVSQAQRGPVHRLGLLLLGDQTRSQQQAQQRGRTDLGASASPRTPGSLRNRYTLWSARWRPFWTTAFKKENIRHVWQMASIVENIWRMKVDEERQPREDRPLEQRAEKLCGQHLEKLCYHCKDDRQILGVVCRESQEHRHHAALLLEKAAQSYRDPMRIILNSQTASGYLSVSPNGKSMMFTGLRMNKCQRGQRFDPEPRVLGSKGFTWGKVYWEVKVDRICWEAEEKDDARRDRAGSRGVFGSRDLGGFIGITDGYHSPGYREKNEELEEEWSQENGIWPKFWLVGVARESVVRRGFLNFTPEEGFWTLQLSSAGVSICTSPEPFQILSYCPQQIGVALDYDGGKMNQEAEP
ncbi:hypothetical protein Celaphus_00014496 [Cervus elaphus hippelaphus]|uniref:B30.2/SPRY domain-containing protein n=1 Tax=Cervus elaphus hippelaphus TaxID=46360 RepID=A0A212D508_CEREH|nr:hypothetical protein Celaphus_00014496 [Cervus elaphus hippelaphus]